MLQESTRPFTEAERRLLRIRSRLPKLGTVYWMQDEPRKAMVTALICTAIFGIGVLVNFPVVGFVAAGTYACMCVGNFFERRNLRKDMVAFRGKLVEEAESGTAYVISCRPVRIFEREEFEDEGAFWIFDGGSGRYLALCGQDHRETPRFPSGHFDLIMGTRHNTFIGVRSYGMRMPSTVVVDGNEISWDAFPADDITLFDAPSDADLPSILRSLDGAETK